MFKKILFPTNFSESSTKALEYIKQLKGLGTEEVVVLTVIKYNYAFMADKNSKIGLVDLEEWRVKNVQKKLETVAHELLTKGFKVKANLERGVVCNKILEAEQRENVCLIVIGSERKNIIKRFLWGSIPNAIVKRSKQSVLVVKKTDYGVATAKSETSLGGN